MFKNAIQALAFLAVGVAPAAAHEAIDVPAYRKAWQTFLSDRSICGERTVMAVDVTPPQLSGFASLPGYKPLNPYTTYVEVTEVEARWTGPGGRVNESDRRNGLEWKGSFQFVAKAARQMTVGRLAQNAAWSAWYGDVLVFHTEVELRNGTWSASGRHAQGIVALGPHARVRRPPCGEVPR